MHTGDKVCVVTDTKKGDLSFALNGANLSVAYERFPLISLFSFIFFLDIKDYSTEFDLSEVEENVVGNSVSESKQRV